MTLLYNLGTPLANTAMSYATGRDTLASITELFFDINVTGREHVPSEGPGIVAANHESYLDIFVASHITERELHFVAKQGLWDIRNFFGAYMNAQCRNWHALPIDRDNPSISQIKGIKRDLNDGNLVFIFPEGTRREGLNGFKDLASMLAYGKDIPVIPVGFKGTRAAWKSFYQGGKPSIEINIGEPMYCEKGEDRKEAQKAFTAELRQEIGRLIGLEGIVG